MREKLLKIINHYGIDKQLKYIHSEYFELDEAIMQYQFGYGDICYPKEVIDNQKEHIVEELSDCFVMLKQFQYYYDIEDSEIEKIMEEKIQRQLKRIEDSKNANEERAN